MTAFKSANIKASEGIDELNAIRTASSPTNWFAQHHLRHLFCIQYSCVYATITTTCNRGVWYVKKGKTKQIVKFQCAGPGGLAEVKAMLDESKVAPVEFPVSTCNCVSLSRHTNMYSQCTPQVQIFLFRVTGIHERGGVTRYDLSTAVRPYLSQ